MSNGAASKLGEMSENGSDVESEKQQQQAVESTTAKNKTHRTTTSTVKFDNGVSVKSVDDDLDDQPMLHTYMNDQTNQMNNHHNNNHHYNHNNHHNHQHEPVSQSVINQKIREYMLKYAFDPDYGYQDFEASADQSLRLEYYTWENQGYITVASFYPDICEFLDKNFQVAANMTYNTYAISFFLSRIIFSNKTISNN